MDLTLQYNSEQAVLHYNSALRYIDVCILNLST